MDLLTRAPAQAPDPRWEEALAGRLATALKLGQSPAIPDLLLQLAAEIAWEAAPFQHALIALVYHRLYGKLLFDFKDIAQVRFSLPVFWALISLAGDRPADASQVMQTLAPAVLRFFRSRSRESEVRDDAQVSHALMQSLQSTALRRAMVPSWAGFWDQWLLLEAVQHWRPGLHGVQHPLAAAVSSLPLAQATVNSRETKPPLTDAKSIKLAAPGWQGQQPEWFRYDWLF